VTPGPPRGGGWQAPKGALIRIQPDGTWDTLWESPDDLPMDLVLEPGGGSW